MGYKFAFITLLLIYGQSAFAQCTLANAPTGYQPWSDGTCTPLPPTNEFSPDANGYPTCTAGRIALSGDGSYSATTFSSSGRPRWNGTAYSYTSSGDAEIYSYTSSTNPNAPVYGFPPNWRCYCMSTGTAVSWPDNNGQTATPAPIPATVGATQIPRQYPVTYDVISTQTSSANAMYAPVPISTNGTDGRVFGAPYGCGCPNFNEIATVNAATDGFWVGSNCAPMVNNNAITNAGGQSVRVLATYNSAVASSAPVLSDAWEVKSGGNYITSFSLPNSGSDQVGLSTYTRRIWTCADPYQMDGANPSSCIFTAAKHACNDGGSSGQPSAVSDLILPGGSKAAQFDAAVNPKLACCLNAFHSDGTDAYEKFDCIDNSQKAYTNFNQLWGDADDSADGGQLNAIILSSGTTAGGSPQIISGFYGLDGHHCDQFSEFAFAPGGGGIKHYKVDPMISATQQTSAGGVTATGVVDPLPASTAYNTLYTAITGKGKSVPGSRSDYLACPILVRAAIVASCPGATMAPNALLSVNETASGTPRCAVAAGIQVHVHIEQIYEITGTAPAPVLDSMMLMNSTTSLDVSKIITSKTGDLCPPGTMRRGELCSY